MTTKTILVRIILCLTIIGLWLWMSADEWEQEMVNDRVEQERISSIQAYNKRMQSSALNEDYVDTTPLPTAEAEPTYMSAPVKSVKKSAVRAKKQIKRTVKRHTR